MFESAVSVLAGAEPLKDICGQNDKSPNRAMQNENQAMCCVYQTCDFRVKVLLMEPSVEQQLWFCVRVFGRSDFDANARDKVHTAAGDITPDLSCRHVQSNILT